MPVKTFRLGEMSPDMGAYFNASESGFINLQEARGLIAVENGYTVQPGWVTMSTLLSGATATSGLGAVTIPVSGISAVSLENRFLVGRVVGGVNDLAVMIHDGSGISAIGRAGNYSVAQPRWSWQFTAYGTRAIATNGVDAIQSAAITSPFGTMAKNNTITSPVTADPRAYFVESFQDHLFIGDFDLTAGTSGGEAYGGAYGALAAQRYPNAVWWSATDNCARFADPATTPSIIGSDYRIFNDGLGPVLGMRAATDYLLVGRAKGFSVITGPPFVRKNIESTVGTLFPNSFVRVNNDIYFMAKSGPCVIRNGETLERLGDSKIKRWLMQTKAILTDSGTSDHNRRIYGARNATGDYIYWCIKDLDITSDQYDFLLIYAVDQKKFSLIRFSSATEALIAITSAPIEYEAQYDQGDAVMALGSLHGMHRLSRDGDNANFISMANTPIYALTSYIGMGDGSGVYQTWKPKRIRPIFSVDPYYSALVDSPDTLVGNVTILPRSKYSGTDRDYTSAASSHGKNEQTGTYVTCPRLQDGWFSCEDAVDSHFYAIKIAIDGDNAQLYSLFHLVGFDMEFELSGLTPSGKELTY